MNLFIEGIPGSGKSTFLNKYAMEHPEYQVYREGDYSPLELAWCAYMTEEEYQAALVKYSTISEEIERWTVREPLPSEAVHGEAASMGVGYDSFSRRYIVPYTRIITDEPGFHKYMEQFEIYQGRKSPEEFQQIILGRYQTFFASSDMIGAETQELSAEERGVEETGRKATIMECAFFQNILEELMLFFECTDTEIFDFYRKMFEIVRETDFKVYYLYDPDVEKIIGHIAKERADSRGNMLWYPMLLAYLQESPYGKKHGFRGMEDVTAHYKRRQKLELWIIREILGERGQVLPTWHEVKYRLPREFFTRDGITVARELLGKKLVHETPYGTVRGIITEVESYMGEHDKGSHTYGGRRTERTEPMYHIGGTSYVYLIYGMYSCMNVACMTDGIPQAVLLRSVVPADAESERIMQIMRLEPLNRKQEKLGKTLYTRENLPDSIKKHLADGPGKMCIAMDITRADNDIDMVKSETFYFTEGIDIKQEQIKAGKRIGIDYAEEAADYLWRFYVEQR